MASPDLAAHLSSLLPSSHPQLRDQVLPKLLACIHDIANTLRTSPSVTQIGTANAFGDNQLNVDVLAEGCIRKTIASCPSIVTASSEEDPIEKASTPSSSPGDEKYTLAFDPLDGSSIIAPNWSVGTIIGIWDSTSALHQPPSTHQIAAILGVLGPRTTAIVALRLPGTQGTCFEIGYSAAGTMQVVRPNIKLTDPTALKTRYFSPANMRAAADEPKYLHLITRFVKEKYTLRYSGGLVPDVVHALVKGHGVYISPVTAQSEAKLRRLYELAPIALVVECAGGVALDSATGDRVLERCVRDTDERGGLICGNGDEVEQVRRALIEG
ncbi:sedoheptulose-1,7-bisphosphatase [Decorospora gaudefroyi]|uniref:Sedoheptulose-1,7-bisphosphatase n=1 Tax=Decorospora gaudefroyi TaxID=184978 RepID=A0A6A5KA85_9PLEO|nr:sedoheptulose-1,7-bisphosphatase [Decorospora gaudefroyi]